MVDMTCENVTSANVMGRSGILPVLFADTGVTEYHLLLRVPRIRDRAGRKESPDITRSSSLDGYAWISYTAAVGAWESGFFASRNV